MDSSTLKHEPSRAEEAIAAAERLLVGDMGLDLVEFGFQYFYNLLL